MDDQNHFCKEIVTESSNQNDYCSELGPPLRLAPLKNIF